MAVIFDDRPVAHNYDIVLKFIKTFNKIYPDGPQLKLRLGIVYYTVFLEHDEWILFQDKEIFLSRVNAIKFLFWGANNMGRYPKW